MDYSDKEKNLLQLMERTDFKNLSKSDVFTIVAKLSELPPDVASKVLAQFPQFVKLAQSQMTAYKDILGKIIASDDESIKQEYTIITNDQQASKQSREQFYDFAKIVHSDISKCLDKENLTPDQMNSLLDREMEIFHAVSEKDSEIRKQETEAVQIADKKDSEKRDFNWNAIKIASGVLTLSVVIGAAALGVNIKIPKKLI